MNKKQALNEKNKYSWKGSRAIAEMSQLSRVPASRRRPLTHQPTMSNAQNRTTDLFIVYMDRPNTLTMQYIVLFSHRTVQLPSVVLSQKHELAVWSPAPFFCIITHVTEIDKKILQATKQRMRNRNLRHTLLGIRQLSTSTSGNEILGTRECVVIRCRWDKM